MTLRARLTAAFLVVMIGPVLLGAVLVGRVVATVDEDRSEHRLELAARAAASVVGSRCRQLQAVAEMVAGQPGAARQALADGLIARGQVASVQVRDGSGAVTAAAGTLPARPWADCHRPEAPGGDRFGALSVRMAVPDAAGAPAGQVRLTEVLDDTLLTDLAETVGTDITLLTPDAAGPVADTARELAPGQMGRSGNGQWVHRVATGDGQPLPLVLSIPRADPQPWLALLVVAMVGAAGLAVAVAWWLARATARPLTELAQAAERVADGDLTTRVPVRAGDEAGQVAVAFNRMAHRGGAYRQALAASRGQLREHLAVLGETLSSTHDLDRILRVILLSARAATGAGAGAVVLLDPATRTLAGQRTDPAGSAPDATADLTVPLEGSLLGMVALTGEAKRGRAATAEVGLHRAEPRCHTFLLAPISAVPGPATPAAAAAGDGDPRPATVRGVLALYDRVGGDDFDDADLATLRTFAGQAAVAVDNVRTHEEAQRLSVTDPLTGLGNYRFLRDALRREVERAGRFGRMLTVLALDLDRFKNVNDAYGHAAGDAVLAEFARRVGNEIREVDSAYRQGGEEFVVLLPETDARGGVVVAQRLGAAIRRTPMVIGVRGTGEQIPVAVTVSIGVAVYPDHARTPDGLLDAADDALYAAKAAGRDTFRVVAGGEAPTRIAVRPRDGRAADATTGVDATRDADATTGADVVPGGTADDPDPSGGGAKPPRRSRGR